jgi:hypothetical protein
MRSPRKLHVNCREIPHVILRPFVTLRINSAEESAFSPQEKQTLRFSFSTIVGIAIPFHSQRVSEAHGPLCGQIFSSLRSI